MEIFITKAPQPTPPGVYGDREWTALKNHWSQVISPDVKRFRKSLSRVYAGNLSGCSEQDKINIAVVMHRGKSDAPDSRLSVYDPTMWKFYECWRFLRKHPAFMINTEASISVSSLSSLDADDPTTSNTMDEEFKKKRIKLNEDLLVALKQRQKAFSDYVSSMQQSQKFRNAAIGFKLFKDSDPEEAEKYKKMMSDIIMRQGGMNESSNEMN